MASKNRNACTWPDCPEPKDKERGGALCEEHESRWIQPDAFRAAARDEGVRFAMSISKAWGLREVAKHRRRWVKSEAAKENTWEDGR